jgi:hypothetical protein
MSFPPLGAPEPYLGAGGAQQLFQRIFGSGIDQSVGSSRDNALMQMLQSLMGAAGQLRGPQMPGPTLPPVDAGAAIVADVPPTTIPTGVPPTDGYAQDARHGAALMAAQSPPGATMTGTPRVDDIASGYAPQGSPLSQQLGGFNQLRNEEYLGNPRLALLNAMGGSEPYNYMMKRILGEYDQAIPLLATLSGYQSGNPEVDIAEFSKQFLGGLTGRGPRQDIGSQITSLLSAAAGGNDDAIALLDEIGASGAMSALGLGDRQRGVLPAFQRARQARRQREYDAGEVRRINRGAVEGQTAATGDTATWARMLAQLAGR